MNGNANRANVRCREGFELRPFRTLAEGRDAKSGWLMAAWDADLVPRAGSCFVGSALQSLKVGFALISHLSQDCSGSLISSRVREPAALLHTGTYLRHKLWSLHAPPTKGLQRCSSLTRIN